MAKKKVSTKRSSPGMSEYNVQRIIFGVLFVALIVSGVIYFYQVSTKGEKAQIDKPVSDIRGGK